MNPFRIVVALLSTLLMLAPAAFAQHLDIQLKKLARRPAAVERAPEEKLAEQEARRAAKPILLEQERAGLVDSAREIAERVDRESILRDVRQYQTIQRALSGLRR